MKKTKVLFAVHQLNYGGVQKSAITALNAIDYSGNDVTLYVRKNRLQLLPEVNRNVSRIIVNEDPTRYYRIPYLAWLSVCQYMARLVKNRRWDDALQKKIVTYLTEAQMNYEKEHYFPDTEEYDIAVSYISGYTAEFVARCVNAKRKIMFYHASTDENHDLHEEIMPCFDRIVGVNENVRNILRELYPSVSNRMTYIDNYVDAEEIRRKSLLFTPDRPEDRAVLCSCGRFAPVKGFDLAVRAAKLLKEKGIRFLWYFVGDGPERVNLEQMISEYGLEDCIRITGMQDNPYPYLGCCDVYVQPSYEEAYGLTIAEAQILGKPVVTTATVGGKFLIENEATGLISDIGADDLADQIIRMLSEEDLRQRIADSLQKIDYTADFLRYQSDWKRLLEEKI
ncbi:MAG: glycosyltransferase [Clostridia bacterium]|nr:glycosyltransferase [Clostridia bacterium]